MERNSMFKKLTSKQKRIIDLGVKKVVREYGETLRLLGKGERYQFTEKKIISQGV